MWRIPWEWGKEMEREGSSGNESDCSDQMDWCRPTFGFVHKNSLPNPCNSIQASPPHPNPFNQSHLSSCPAFPFPFSSPARPVPTGGAMESEGG